MQDLFGSVRRSLVLRTSSGGGEDGGGFGGFVDKIGSTIRKSRIGLFSKLSAPPMEAPPIRWRKGELVGCGAFGRVYMGMNLDSGELLAVKQVLIAANSASKEKTQAHIRELEEEVKLLKNLWHPNIVRYLGTARENDSLNILLEFVPGGSISSLLGKFGSFPESVIRMYTKQLLLGLEYLHNNGIMHRDIKGANILVDNKGCIKLADFGASKKVVELATINGAKSMKGTPYWMAPEVILQTGHNFSADIWSVGCTVIEMATGKPPWSQQYQEVAALFHIGTTKSHPPIPEHLSDEAKDFLLKCLQKEPYLRHAASDLLKHPFITGKYDEPHPVFRTSVVGSSGNHMAVSGMDNKNSFSPVIRRSSCTGLKDICGVNGIGYSALYPEEFVEGPCWGVNNSNDDMCQIDDIDDLLVGASVKLNSALAPDDSNKSFNPMCKPTVTDDWSCKFDENLELDRSGVNLSSSHMIDKPVNSLGPSVKEENDFTFPCEPLAAEDDDELTESKIREFLDEKALDLKKLQSPLYEEFFNTMNAIGHSNTTRIMHGENRLNLPPKSRSPNRVSSRRFSAIVGSTRAASPGSSKRGLLNASDMHGRALQEIQPPQLSEWKDLDVNPGQISPSASFCDRQQKWKEELDEELRRKREMMYQQAGGGKSSPNHRIINKQRQRLRFAVSGK